MKEKVVLFKMKKEIVDGKVVNPMSEKILKRNKRVKVPVMKSVKFPSLKQVVTGKNKWTVDENIPNNDQMDLGVIVKKEKEDNDSNIASQNRTFASILTPSKNADSLQVSMQLDNSNSSIVSQNRTIASVLTSSKNDHSSQTPINMDNNDLSIVSLKRTYASVVSSSGVDSVHINAMNQRSSPISPNSTIPLNEDQNGNDFSDTVKMIEPHSVPGDEILSSYSDESLCSSNYEMTEYEQSDEGLENNDNDNDIDSIGGAATMQQLLFKSYFKIVEQSEDNQNFGAECLACINQTGLSKIFRASTLANSNLLRHLKKKHPEKHQEYKNGMMDSTKQTRQRRRMQRVGLPLSQEEYEDSLLDLVIQGMLPVSIVTSDEFKEYTHKISTGKAKPSVDDPHFNVISPNTIKSRIHQKFQTEMEGIKKELEAVHDLSTSCDIWSNKHKSFMGVTCHWINEKTLKRESRALCCRRFKSPHDADRVAEILNLIHKEFNIDKKVIGTVTDNAGNFVAAFNDFGITLEEFHKLCNVTEEIDLHEYADDDVDELINGIRSTHADSPIEIIYIDDLFLSSHFRCGCHTLNLIASSDVEPKLLDQKYQKQHKSTKTKKKKKKKKHKSAFSKLNALWIASNRPKSSKIIENILGSALILPVKTRWNSLHIAVKCVTKYDIQTLNRVMVALELPMFTQADYTFLQEYEKITKPIADATMNLQFTNCYYGLFLPTLHSVEFQLAELKKEKFVYCTSLLNAIHKGFMKRFRRFFDKMDDQCIAATIAAVTHPHFKTRWINDKLVASDYFDWIKETLVSAALKLPSPKTSQPCASESATSSTNKSKFRYTFFEKNSSQQEIDKKQAVEIEVLSYLSSPATDDHDNLSELDKFAYVRRLFIKYNSLLPSSAPVERLFSFDKMILRPQRQRLGDQFFEELLILKSKRAKPSRRFG